MLRVLAALMAAAACGGAPRGGDDRCSGRSITTPEELAAIAGCAVIGGDLEITGAAIDSLEPLAGLREVSGDLSLGPSSRLGTARGLRSLERVGGSVSVAHNFELGGLYLAALTDVGGALRIERNLALATVALQSLRGVGAELRVADNGALEWLDLSALRSVGGDLVIAGPEALVLQLAEGVAAGGAIALP